MEATTLTMPKDRRHPAPGLIRCGCGAVLDDEDVVLPCADCRRDAWEDQR
jgi:hypothetical protein